MFTQEHHIIAFTEIINIRHRAFNAITVKRCYLYGLINSECNIYVSSQYHNISHYSIFSACLVFREMQKDDWSTGRHFS